MDSFGKVTGSRRAIGVVALASALALSGACTRNDPNQLLGGTGKGTCTDGASSSSSGSSSSGATTGTTGAGGSGSGGSGAGGEKPTGTVLDERVVDYNEALRTAAFKLVGNAPTLQQMLDLKAATKPAEAYAVLVDQMMTDTRFASRLIAFWQNTMRLGGPAAGQKPSRDTAPTFAARVVFEGRPYTDLFTASEHLCPTFDGSTFTDGECPNGPPAGILGDPGMNAQYHGNMAFRRNRFVQETFACRKQPSELSATPKPMGAGSYTSPWPFESIAGAGNGGRIDFHDVSSAICANCHSTANHRSPLFAYYDENGKYQTTFQVAVPVAGTPVAVMDDWLPPGEGLAWKFGVPVTDITGLGAAMAKDPEVISCAVKRMWNYAMSKGDIVIDAADVPDQVVASFTAEFAANGHNLREVLRSMLVSPDFVRF